jgi:uncharacterized membrane protein HdeD (DUF308 family)
MAFQGGGWGIGTLGALNIILGLVLLFNPLIGAAFLPFILGGFALVGGIVAIVLRSTCVVTRRHKKLGRQGRREPHLDAICILPT